MDQEILDDLRRDYEAGKLIVFAGAGISAGARIPGWKALAENLLERARKRGAEASALDEIEEYIKTNKLIDAISAARNVLGREFEIAVRHQLDDAGRDVPPAADAIAALSPKLCAVLTTNLDRFLERAFKAEWEALVTPTGDIAQQRGYIWKIHGTLRDASTWVFLRDQYDRAMFVSQNLQETVRALYRSHPFLFVGFGLADDNIDLTLGNVRAQSGGQPPSHYALMPKKGMGPQRRKTLEDAGIRLLLYENADGTHGEVVSTLRALAGGAPKPIPVAPGAPGPSGTATPPRAAAQDDAAEPVRVFVSYAPKDEAVLERLETHLKQLVRRKRIDLFHERKIEPGAERALVIEQQLARADVFLFLLSADFLASDEKDLEMTRALERRRVGKVPIIPIIVRPCGWKESQVSELQPWPNPREREDPHDPSPISARTHQEQEAAFEQMARDLRAIVDTLRPAR